MAATKSSRAKRTTPAKAASSSGSVRPTEASTVGATLKSRRIGRGLTLKDIETATRIRGKYLLAIEADDYRELPHDVYTRGFVQSYAEHVGLDSAEIVRQYSQQRGEQELQLRRAGMQSRRFVLTPRLLTSIGGGIVAAAVAAYLVYQLSAVAAPPKLEITNPSKDQVLYGSLINVSGHVAGGADVYVNNSPILVDDDGNFTDAIALQNGVNDIEVTAKNRLGKTTTVTRNILAHVPKVDPASQLPTSPFNGVAVSIQVQSRAATINVRADGKEVFKGTMLPGTSQVFMAAGNVVISTTDGGATNVTVTNQMVAGKSLGQIGKPKQPKNNFEFARDTQFQ